MLLAASTFRSSFCGLSSSLFFLVFLQECHVSYHARVNQKHEASYPLLFA